MNKNQLIDEVHSKNYNLTRVDVDRVVTEAFEVIKSVVASGDHVRLGKFGTFELKVRTARLGRNPKTGEPVKVPAIKVPSFRAGNVFRDLANSN